MSSTRNDGWASFFSGFGIRGRDTTVHDQVSPPREFTRTELEWVYRGDAIAARAVDILPDDATRQGWRLGFDGGDAAAAAKAHSKIMKYHRRLGSKKTLRQGLSLGRLHGGAIAVMGITDGGELHTPVRRDAIQSIRWIRLISRWFVEPGPIDDDPRSDFFGTPKHYMVTNLMGSASEAVKVHTSRVLRFPGVFDPASIHFDPTSHNQGWDDSVITRIAKPLSRFEMGYASAARVSTDFSRATYTIDGLARMMGAGQEAQIRRRIDIAEMSISVLGALLLDPKESFTFNTRDVTGFTEILNHLGIYLSAATSIPMTRLLGLSPGGFGTGDDEDRRWDDVTLAYQDEVYRPILERWVEYTLLAKDGPTGGQLPDGWEIEFNPLSVSNPKEEAEIRKLIADALVAQVNARILLPEEAAQAMHGGTRFGIDVVLDTAARASLEASAKAGKQLEETGDPDALEEELGKTRAPEDVKGDALHRSEANVLHVLERIDEGRITAATGARFLNRFHGMPLEEAEVLAGAA